MRAWASCVQANETGVKYLPQGCLVGYSQAKTGVGSPQGESPHLNVLKPLVLTIREVGRDGRRGRPVHMNRDAEPLTACVCRAGVSAK